MNENKLSEDERNLIDAVARYDLERVQQYLLDGVNVNCNNGSGEFQPSTPLKMVVFRISDCMLNDDNLEIYEKIAKLLLENGADKQAAIEYAETRYGKMQVNNFNDDNAMDKILKIIYYYNA